MNMIRQEIDILRNLAHASISQGFNRQGQVNHLLYNKAADWLEQVNWETEEELARESLASEVHYTDSEPS